MWSLMPWKKNDPTNGNTMTVSPLGRDVFQVRDEFDRLFHQLWNMNGFDFDARLSDRWGLDIEEEESHYVARLDAPGFEIEDFDIQATSDNLVVKAERKESQEGKRNSSRRMGRLEHTISLPTGADTEKIGARYHNGVLELRIPKGEAKNVKRIAVTS
jgi:HSP20 family protein